MTNTDEIDDRLLGGIVSIDGGVVTRARRPRSRVRAIRAATYSIALTPAQVTNHYLAGR